MRLRYCPAFILAALLFAAPATADAAASVNRAYGFLDSMMDRYETGSTPRLMQSFVPTATFNSRDKASTYDNAVAIVALVARGTPDDMKRARLLGDALIALQNADRRRDGRLRDAYHARLLLRGDGSANVYSGSSASHTGNMAWAGIALVQLYRATAKARYLAAAEAVAQFVQNTAFDARGAGGYDAGFDSSGQKLMFKGTEHNIDLYGLFVMLAQATGDRQWSGDASHALNFIAAMWNPAKQNFHIGTTDDGATVNTGDPTPEDIQSWSFLALKLPQYEASIDWALANLSATAGSFKGTSFDTSDRSGVWFEGTAHLAEALRVRRLAGDKRRAAQLLTDIETGQADAPNADGRGIDAASKDGLKADGDLYFAALHVGATAWYCLAAQHANPFRFVAEAAP